MKLNDYFSLFTRASAYVAGLPIVTVLAFLTVIIWGVTGPYFEYSDTWQLVINTFTTVVTFLIVFLIQNSQNRDNLAIQIKLDEIIRSQEGAHNSLFDLENLSQEELIEFKKRFEEHAVKSRYLVKKGKKDTETKEI